MHNAKNFDLLQLKENLNGFSDSLIHTWSSFSFPVEMKSTSFPGVPVTISTYKKYNFICMLLQW